MVRLFLLVCLLAMAPAHADNGFFNFFNYIQEFITDIWLFFTETIPDLFTRFWIWLLSYIILAKIEGYIFAVELSSAVALSVLDLLSFDDIINSALAALPNDVQAIMSEFGIIQGLTIIFEAYITRLVYSFIN